MFREMKTGSKVLIGFTASVLISVTVGLVGYRGLTLLHGVLDEMTERWIPSIVTLGVMNEGQTAIEAQENALLSTELSSREREERMAEFATIKKRIDDAWKIYEATPQSKAEAIAWKEFLSAWDRWWRDHMEFERLEREYEREKTPESYANFSKQALAVSDQSYGECKALLNKLIEINKEDTDTKASEVESQTQNSTAFMFAAIGLGALTLLILGIAISRSVGGALRTLIEEATRLAKAATNGKLDARGNGQIVTAEFRGIITGMNESLEALVAPIKVAANYVERISKGDIPPKIADKYNGDFNDLKDNLNRCVDAVNSLVGDANQLVQAAVNGELSTRVDASKHQGDFAKIVEGINKTLDAMMAPITESAGVLEKLAERDMRVRVKGTYRGDHAKIKDAVNSTATGLHDALVQVAEAVDQVAAASGQIATSSQAVADGSSRQAGSLQETSSSLESLTSMTKQAADSAQQANALAQVAKGSASEGSRSMEQMVAAMQKIRSASEGTSEIIKDINDITFQTNLLALNAAVEAARAGDAGRGFAVVAEEVRSLALRSKEAARKTEELIKQSVKQAADGEAISKQVSTKLNEILGAADKVSAIVGEIAAASKEQAVGIEQINKAVAEMDSVTQSNASSSEETSSAAEELAAQSQELAALVSRFAITRSDIHVDRPDVARGARAHLLVPPAAAKPAAKRLVASAKAQPHKPVNPEEVIPLESDHDTNRLKQF